MDDHFESADDNSSVSTTVVPRRHEQRDTRQQPRYHVLLWDDNDHSYEYVIQMMQSLFGHPMEKSYKIASEVDHSGRAICLTTTMEHAELKRDQIHSFGKDNLLARCQGAMSASIEAENS